MIFLERYIEQAVVLSATSPQPLQSLAGAEFAVKHNISVEGKTRQAGSPALPATPATTTSSVVTRLLDAGAVCSGSLNMHELALGTTSNNAHFGPVLNPRDTSRISGGSSGGSAAAVANGSVAFALGTDTGGSCRIPAAYCGVVGMRPSTGRYPSDGVFMISPTRDTVGVFANFVSDIALVDSAITGEDNLELKDPSEITIGIPRMGFFTEASPEVATVVEFAIERLELAGITFVDVEVPGTHDIALAGLHIVAFEAPREVLRLFGFEPTTYSFTTDELRLLRLFVDDIASQDVKSIFGHFVESPVDEATYLRALDKREKLQGEYDKVFAQENLDALIYPTVGIVAPEVGHDTIVVNGQERPHFPYSISNTDPGSLAGLPSISIPIPRLAGALPVGLGVECSHGNDRHLLAVSTVIEEILTSS